MDDQHIPKIVEAFRGKKGATLYDVFTQESEIEFLPTERDRVSTKEIRVGLDFQDNLGKFSSVFLRFAIEEGQLIFRGLGEYKD